MLEENPSERVIVIRKQSPNAEFLGHQPDRYSPGIVFDRLAEQFEDFLKPNRFRASRIEMKLPVGDPELENLLSAATDLGLRLPKHSQDHLTQITIRDYIRYSLEDIQGAEFVECLRFNPFIVCSSDKKPGKLDRVASNKYIKQCRNRLFGSFVNLYHLLAVRGDAKTALEAEELRGLKLIPLIPDSPWPSGIEPLHLIWAENSLPPLEYEQVLDGDFEIIPKLRYPRLNSSEFDIAITSECFGNSAHYHRIIFSRKARGVLETLDPNLRYRPVMTDADQ